jgi:hypothetical protein
MRLKTGIVAAVLAAGTTFILRRAGFGSAGRWTELRRFPTQIDIPNSILGDLDPTDLDENDNGVGCEARPAPPRAYDLTKNPPVLLEPEPEPPPPAPATEPGAAPAEPVTAEIDFTG